MALRTVLSGLQDFAISHICEIFEAQSKGILEFIAACEERQENIKPRITKLKTRGVRLYKNFDKMLECEKPEVVFIASPPGTRFERTLKACKANCYVLVDKSPAVTIQELLELIEAEKKLDKKIGVNFYKLNGPVQQIKQIICEGKLGEIRKTVSMGRFRRSNWYYDSGPWAGTIRHNGTNVLDCPTFGDYGHWFFNALYISSSVPKVFAQPAKVRAEMYRARPDIDCSDIDVMEIETLNGVKVYWYTAYAVPKEPIHSHEIFGTKADLEYKEGTDITITYKNGETEKIAIDPYKLKTPEKNSYVKYINNEVNEPLCSLEETIPFVKSVNLAFESSKKIIKIPDKFVDKIPYKGNVQDLIYIPDQIHELLDKASEKCALFSDINVPWAQKTDSVSAENFNYFDIDKL
jgi:predicted dehydrogenase